LVVPSIRVAAFSPFSTLQAARASAPSSSFAAF
jgi:hypothetical protein